RTKERFERQVASSRAPRKATRDRTSLPTRSSRRARRQYVSLPARPDVASQAPFANGRTRRRTVSDRIPKSPRVSKPQHYPDRRQRSPSLLSQQRRTAFAGKVETRA